MENEDKTICICGCERYFVQKSHWEKKKDTKREFGKDNPVYMHSSAPFVQAQTLNRVLKLCAKHSTEMQPIQTHIQHCQNNDDSSDNDDDLWKPIILMDSSAKQTSGMLSI